VVPAADPRRIARLLTLLLADPPEHRQVLVLDDLGAVTRALDLVPRGLGLDLLDRVLRERSDLGVVATGDPRDLTRWAPLAALRLVLAVQDPADDVLLGLPRSGHLRSTPGRALGIRGDSVTLCQIALSDGPGPAAAAPRADRVQPHRLAPLPGTTSPGRPEDRPTDESGRHAVLIGVGGDDASGVMVDVSRGLLVVGPSGTGRSTALATLVGELRQAGCTVATIARDGPLTCLPSGSWSADPTGAAALVRRCSGPDGPDVLVVDDLDLFARTDPATDEAFAGWVHEGVGPVLVAAARTDLAAAAYRGACAALRGSAARLVLAPLEPGSQDVAGCDLALAADPTRPRHPGRGVLVQGGHLTPVQVALSGPCPPGG
jgi:S-DNA-T family DNA segregation ATPase FtsK/SpoIIIE